jgi:hypothetical protein
MGHYENGRGHGDIFAPDRMFEADAVIVFGERCAMPNFDLVVGGGTIH